MKMQKDIMLEGFRSLVSQGILDGKPRELARIEAAETLSYLTDKKTKTILANPEMAAIGMDFPADEAGRAKAQEAFKAAASYFGHTPDEMRESISGVIKAALMLPMLDAPIRKALYEPGWRAEDRIAVLKAALHQAEKGLVNSGAPLFYKHSS